MKNRYVGRTFIQPSQTMRQLGIRIKLNPLREAIRGCGWWWSTTRSCAATPPRRSSPCSARGRGPRGPRPHHLAPGALALLLRHRHADPGRAGRQRPAHRRGGQLRRRRLPATCRWRPSPRPRPTATGPGALHGLLHGELPDPGGGPGPGQGAARGPGAPALDGEGAAHLRPGRGRRRGRRPGGGPDAGRGGGDPRAGVLGGIGGFAGLWRLAGPGRRRPAPTRCWPRPATASAPSCWSPRPSTATTPSASTWSPWWSTTWS